jgi:hypothetical protein
VEVEGPGLDAATVERLRSGLNWGTAVETLIVIHTSFE